MKAGRPAGCHRPSCHPPPVSHGGKGRATRGTSLRSQARCGGAYPQGAASDQKSPSHSRAGTWCICGLPKAVGQPCPSCPPVPGSCSCPEQPLACAHLSAPPHHLATAGASWARHLLPPLPWHSNLSQRCITAEAKATTVPHPWPFCPQHLSGQGQEQSHRSCLTQQGGPEAPGPGLC